MQRILVIDDDEAVRTSFELALEDAPFELLVAESGEQGLSLGEEKPVDLVFLDLKMPGLDGVETLRRIRAAGWAASVYIVTGFAEQFMERLRAAANEGLQFELLQKPVELTAICEIAAATLDHTPSLEGLVH